jgi:outer membrane cobalamin receptor
LYIFPSSNEDLQEEKISSLEIGSIYHFTKQNSVQFSVYQNDIRNMIQEVYTGPPPPLMMLQNSFEGRQFGFESKLTYFPVHTMGFQFSYSYLNPDDLTAFNPTHQLKYLFLFRFNQLIISLYGKYIGKLYAENNKDMRLSDYNTIDMSISTEIRDISFKIGLNNVFDRKYKVLPDYQAPGFHIFAGIIYKLKQ